LDGQKFRRPAGRRKAVGIDDQGGCGTEHHHHRGEYRARYAELTMDVRPRVSDQRYLHREQRQIANEGDCMKVDDQRVIETVLAQVIEAVGAETREHSHPD
jgi:hypothetical protein